MEYIKIQKLYEKSVSENLNSLEFIKQFANLFMEDKTISCSSTEICKIPKDKESEFCEKISFAAWEDRCRGYELITSEYILNTINQLKSK